MNSSSESSGLNPRLQVNHSTCDHLLLLTPSLFTSLEKLIILIPKKVCININLFYLSTGLDNELLNLDKKNIYEIQKSLLTWRNQYFFFLRILGIIKKIIFIEEKNPKAMTSVVLCISEVSAIK